MTFLESVDNMGQGVSLVTTMLALYVKDQWAAIMDARMNGAAIDTNEEYELRWVVKLMNELIKLQKKPSIGMAIRKK